MVQDGHIWLNGERVRFWGCAGGFPGKSHADNEAVVRRLKDMGFNMVRFWRGFPEPTDYVKGDGSRADLTDHFLWQLKENGMRAWCAGLNRVGKAMPGDVNIIDDPETAGQWEEAVNPDGVGIRRNPARIWDPRLNKLGIARMKQVADHFNQYTGTRWADDPLFAVWELSNEEWWFRRMMGGSFLKLPEFFQRELLEQWNGFLQTKYENSDGLIKAWSFLLPGESLKEGTVLLLPLKSEVHAEPQGIALGLRLEESIEQELGPRDFTGTRGSDVIQFLLSIWIGHKQAEADAVKSWGRSCRLCPLVWDTGIGFEMQSQFLHQHADAVAHDSYISGFHHDPTHKRFPWYSGLEELPRLCWDRPWLEHNHAPGKPFFAYENQINNPAKYRAEYPMRIASLGAIQDWDIIIWHYFGHVPDSSKERPYDRFMDYTSSEHGHPQGLHFQWIQYQLDNHSSVEEVIKSDSDVRIIPHKIGMHFLICDGSENVAVIEFLDGKMVSYTGDELPIPSLTNNPYGTTIRYMTEQANDSHDNDYGESLESIIRSVTQAEQINNYHALTPKPDIYDYAFKILQSVGGSATQWSIVYDMSRSRMLYRTSVNQHIRTLQLEGMDFSCASTDMVLAADADPDDGDSFEEFSLWLNEKLINGVLHRSDFLHDSLSGYRERMIAYPKTTRRLETP